MAIATDIKITRNALGLTQEEFATRFNIPLGTLRDWEQGRTEPDAPSRAYLEAIARHPERFTYSANGPTDFRQAGIAVRDLRDPSVKGTTSGQIRSHAGRSLAGVRLLNGETTFVPIVYLEPLPEFETRVHAFAARRTGGCDVLLRQLLAEKVSGRLTDVYYSMESGKADFFPHQFRPVLTFVESTIGRLLIADEVGLGKTISAIYVWKELVARTGARRLLVVCPAALREKWRAELRTRFSIEAKIVDATDLREELETTHRDTSRGFALIGGLEGLRSRRRTTNDERANRSRRQKLMEWLQDNSASSEFSPFDLVIVDEAHAARNPNTANHHFVEALRDASAHLVLLTATPIQTHSDNLFNLLKLVDPDRFVSPDTFEQARRANISVIGAVNALQQIPPDFDSFRHHLEHARNEPLFQNDSTLAGLTKDAGGNWDQAKRVHVSRMLESRSLLADVMVRTRKREAFKDRVQRVPWVLEVELSPQEQQLYERLSDRIKAVASDKYPDTPATFVLIARQRQLASSIPAALKAWKNTRYLEELLWDDLGLDMEDSDRDNDDISIEDLLDGYDFEENDTKYKKFSEALRNRLSDYPDEKIVVFAFFRGTLAYLRDRLEAEGVHCASIHGSMGTVLVGDDEVDAKSAEIARFAAPGGPSVLLSSEVGSEGIDLQFAHALFNYDLPWNPMRVEQRIGRIDRLGQKAERIAIGHFITTGTVDDRIINRLYDRVNVFRESIGDLDEIFGERIQNVLLDYFRQKLTIEEAERRIEQNIIAEETYKLETKRLDQEAPALAGHADFILRSISQSHTTGRFVRPDDLRNYITGFLHERYPGSSIEYDKSYPDLFRIDLSAYARDELGSFIESSRPARHTRMLVSNVAISFDPSKPMPAKLRPEIVDVTHPLVLWMRATKASEKSDMVPAVAVAISATNTEAPPGLYCFATDLWRMEGIRRQATLQHVVICAKTGKALEARISELLIDRVCQDGTPVDLMEVDSVHGTLVNALRACEEIIDEKFLSELAAFEAENANRVSQVRQLVDARAARKIERLRSILDEQMNFQDERQRRVIPLTEARIRRAQEEQERQLARIDRQKRVESSFRSIVGGLIIVRPENVDLVR